MEMGTLLVSLLCSVELPHVFRWRMGADIYTKGEAAMASSIRAQSLSSHGTRRDALSKAALSLKREGRAEGVLQDFLRVFMVCQYLEGVAVKRSCIALIEFAKST